MREKVALKNEIYDLKLQYYKARDDSMEESIKRMDAWINRPLPEVSRRGVTVIKYTLNGFCHDLTILNDDVLLF